MDQCNRPWRVVHERITDGPRHYHEELEETISKQDEPRTSQRPNATVLYQTKAHSNAALNSRNAPISVHRINCSLETEIQDFDSYTYSPGPEEDIAWLNASHSDPDCTASTSNQHNQVDYIPRSAESIPTLLNTPDLFPHLQNDTFEKWVQLCEPYRDRSYSGADIHHFTPLSQEEVENGPLFKLITATYKQPDIPCVEKRHNQEQPDDEIDNGPLFKLVPQANSPQNMKRRQNQELADEINDEAVRSIDEPKSIPTISTDAYDSAKEPEPNSILDTEENPITKVIDGAEDKITPNERTLNAKEQYSLNIDSLVQIFLDDMFKQLGESFLLSPNSSFVSHGGYHSSSNYTGTPSSFSSSPYYNHKLISSKRCNESEDERDNDLNKGPKRPRTGWSRRGSKKGDLGRRLACHLHLFAPQKYCKNSVTGKRYDTCSGPGWPTIHHLKQHLGNSSSSVHNKLRCAGCHRKFKSQASIMVHIKQEGFKCIETPLPSDQDDEGGISDSAWLEIESATTRNNFDQLSQDVRENIDLWVSKSVFAYAPTEPMDTRKSELRKWFMIWRILYPTTEIPPHPFYENHLFIPPNNAEHLITTFKETVEADIAASEFDGITDEDLGKLQECLRKAIRIIAASMERSFSDIGADQNQDLDMLKSDRLQPQGRESLQLPSQSQASLSQGVPSSTPTPTLSGQREQITQIYQRDSSVDTAFAVGMCPQTGTQSSQSSLVRNNQEPLLAFEPNSRVISNETLERDSYNICWNDLEAAHSSMELQAIGIDLGSTPERVLPEDWEQSKAAWDVEQWDSTLSAEECDPVLVAENCDPAWSPELVCPEGLARRKCDIKGHLSVTSSVTRSRAAN